MNHAVDEAERTTFAILTDALMECERLKKWIDTEAPERGIRLSPGYIAAVYACCSALRALRRFC